MSNQQIAEIVAKSKFPDSKILELIPVSQCAITEGKNQWRRAQVKMLLVAMQRQTKITGPTQFK